MASTNQGFRSEFPRSNADRFTTHSRLRSNRGLPCHVSRSYGVDYAALCAAQVSGGFRKISGTVSFRKFVLHLVILILIVFDYLPFPGASAGEFFGSRRVSKKVRFVPLIVNHVGFGSLAAQCRGNVSKATRIEGYETT